MSLHRMFGEQDKMVSNTVQSENSITIKIFSSSSPLRASLETEKNVKLFKFQKLFAWRFGVAEGTPRFLYRGKRITEHDTPESLNMEEGDIIDVVYKRKSDFSDKSITIEILSSSPRVEVFVKINTDFQLIKLERAFASKFEKEGATPRLLYKGERFTEHDTPESLNMVDCDVIDVEHELLGET